MNQYGCPKAVPKNIAEKGIFLSMFSLNGEFVSLKKTLWSLFMDEVQLSQGCRATSRREFTFYH